MKESAGAVIRIFFCKQGFQKNCAKITKEFLCWSLFFSKFQAMRPASLLTLSWQRLLLYRNQFADLKSKSMDRLMIGASIMKELKRDSSKSVSCKLCYVFKHTYFVEYLLTVASEEFRYQVYILLSEVHLEEEEEYKNILRVTPECFVEIFVFAKDKIKNILQR